MILGIGIGSYREELEAVRPEFTEAHRGTLLDEGIAALRHLFEERRASFEGRYFRFHDVELAPKPVQRPFPILLSARSPAGLRRVARLADGWIIGAAQSASALVSARERLDREIAEQQRDPRTIETYYQVWLSFGRDGDEAEAKLKRSQHFRRMVARRPEWSEEATMAHFRNGSLLGTPADVIERLRAFELAGVAHVGMIVLGDSLDGLLADVELFATRVMPCFTAG